jgi:hypothetical protein
MQHDFSSLKIVHQNTAISNEAVEEVLIDENPSACKLIIEIGKNHIGYLVANSDTTEIFALAFYPLSSSESLSSFYQQIDNHLGSFSIARYKTLWHNPTIVINDAKFCIVPKALFNEQHPEHYFNQIFSNENLSNLFFYKSIDHDAVLLHAIDNRLNAIITRHAPQAQWQHVQESLINFTTRHYGKSYPKFIALDIKGNLLQVIGYGNGSLLFANSFTVQGAEDIAYYTLHAYEHLQYEAHQVPLIVSGNITEGDAIFKLLHKYIKDIYTLKPGIKASATITGIMNDCAFTTLIATLHCEL